MLNFELLKRLCETPGVPGREEQIRAVVTDALNPLVDELSTDVMGNVIGVKRGVDGPTIMIAAHMDEIGFIVKHVDDKGFLRVQPLGGFDPRNLIAQRVYVHCHTGEVLLGAFMPSAEGPDADRSKARKLTDLFIDLGLPADEVKSKVELGDPVTMARTCEKLGDMVVSKSLDNRLSVFVMIEAIRQMSASRCTILAVATVQEEVGLRGALPAAYALNPDIGIALDVTIAKDYPGGSEPERVTQLGKGTAIKIMDSSLICDPRLVKDFRRVAESHSIPYQLEILAAGGTDAGAIQRSRGGVPSFTLSTPTRYIHTVNETAAVADIEASINLLSAWLEEAHQLNLTR
ncbi:MAG: M42 family metallopeptidase [Armatimonas sp.]